MADIKYTDIYDSFLSYNSMKSFIDAKSINESNSETAIADKSINYEQTSLNKLYSGQDIQTDNFVSGSAGWRIRGNGDVEFNSGTFRGALTAATIDIGGSDNSSFHVDINGNLWSGAASYNILTNPFAVSNAGVLRAASGTIGGWTIGTDLLKSSGSGARIELNQATSRVSVFDAVNEKVAMGYLNGLPKNDGTGNWGAGDYGFWARSGDKLSIDGDGEYINGDWIVQNDAAYLVNDSNDKTIVRLGTDSGEKGLFIYNTSGTQLAKYISDEIFIGEATKYLRYTVAGGLEIAGAISGSTIDIGGADTSSFHVDIDGNIWSGASAFASAPFRVSNAGSVTATKIAASNLVLYDAVVDVNGNGDYTTVASAITAGKKAIFVRNGTYNNEPAWNITNDNTTIVGESIGGVVMNLDYSYVEYTSGYYTRIYINAKYVNIKNMTLSVGDNTVTLIRCGSSCKNPTFSDLIVKKADGNNFNRYFIDGGNVSNLFATIKNIHFKLLDTDGDITGYTALCNLNNSLILNCFFDASYGDSAVNIKIIDSSSYCQIIGCQFIATDDQLMFFDIIASHSIIIGCFFYITKLTLKMDMIGSYVRHNGYEDSDPLIYINVANVIMSSCRIQHKPSTKNMYMMLVSAALTNITNNYFDGGGLIYYDTDSITIKGGNFSNNVWRSYSTSTSDVSTKSLLWISSDFQNSNFNNNILRNVGDSHTPTIDDDGTGNDVSHNQFILG